MGIHLTILLDIDIFLHCTFYLYTFYARKSAKLVWIIVFNVTFNNISVILWQSVLLVEETGVPWENHRQVTDKLYHIMLYRVLFHLTTGKLSWNFTCPQHYQLTRLGLSWSWSYSSWIYNYLYNQCLSPLKFMVRCTRYNIMWYRNFKALSKY
jgi:hypothetical protein